MHSLGWQQMQSVHGEQLKTSMLHTATYVAKKWCAVSGYRTVGPICFDTNINTEVFL